MVSAAANWDIFFSWDSWKTTQLRILFGQTISCPFQLLPNISIFIGFLDRSRIDFIQVVLCEVLRNGEHCGVCLQNVWSAVIWGGRIRVRYQFLNLRNRKVFPTLSLDVFQVLTFLKTSGFSLCAFIFSWSFWKFSNV